MNSESEYIFSKPSPFSSSLYFACWGWGVGAGEGDSSQQGSLWCLWTASRFTAASSQGCTERSQGGQRFEGVGISRDLPFWVGKKKQEKTYYNILVISAKIVGCTLQGQFFFLKTSGDAPLFFLLGGEDLGVGKAKAQKRSEAWQLGSRFVLDDFGRGGDGSGWDRTPWPWKRTYMENAWGKSLIHCLFFWKFQPVMLAFTIGFLLTPFVPRWALLGLKKISTNIDLVFHGGCVASSLNITTYIYIYFFFACQVKIPSDKKTHADFFGSIWAICWHT